MGTNDIQLVNVKIMLLSLLEKKKKNKELNSIKSEYETIYLKEEVYVANEVKTNEISFTGLWHVMSIQNTKFIAQNN